MANFRNVTINMKHLTGLAFAGGWVTFKLKSFGVTPISIFPANEKRVKLGEEGTATVSLWTNGDSDTSSIYECVLPTGETFQFVLEDGEGDVSLSALQQLGAPEGTPQYETLRAFIENNQNLVGPTGSPGQDAEFAAFTDVLAADVEASGITTVEVQSQSVTPPAGTSVWRVDAVVFLEAQNTSEEVAFKLDLSPSGILGDNSWQGVANGHLGLSDTSEIPQYILDGEARAVLSGIYTSESNTPVSFALSLSQHPSAAAISIFAKAGSVLTARRIQ